MKRLAIYLIVTFGLTWGLLIPAGFALGTFENGETSSTIMIALIAVSMFFPTLGALAAHFTSKPEERIDLAYKPRIKENVRFYLLAWFAPAVLTLLGIALFFAINPQLFDPSMMSFLESTAAAAGVPIEEITAEMPDVRIVLLAVVFASLTYAPFINMIPAFGEELGWRGMLFPTLCEHMSQRAAVLVSGVIWGLWHAPAIAMGHNYGMSYVGFPIAGILTMVIACTALGSMMCYLRVKTGSVWPCALAHGAVNAIANIGVVFCTAGASILGPSPLGLVAGIPVIVLGIVLWLRMSPARVA